MRRRIARCLFACVLGNGICWISTTCATEHLPQVEDVLRQMVERAQVQTATNAPDAYLCTKQTVTEELDAAGRVTERKVKVHQTRSSGSGKDDANKWSNKNGVQLDEELLRHYRFNIVGREILNSRPAFVLTFVPKQPAAPVHHIQDRFLNRAKGTVWVDEQDYDLVKADICLGEPVSFGILGAVDVFTFAFERMPAGNGDWLTHWTETFIKARKFLKPVQTRKRVDWKDFQKIIAGEQR